MSASSASAEPDPDAVVAAVLACPGVAAMASGVAGEIATYLPGRRVSGVQIRDTSLEVHVVARWVPSLQDLAAHVAAAVAPLAGGRAVGVHIDDLAPNELAAGDG